MASLGAQLYGYSFQSYCVLLRRLCVLGWNNERGCLLVCGFEVGRIALDRSCLGTQHEAIMFVENCGL